MSIDRRSFLKSSIATGLALGFPAVATGQRDKTYRTALIGSRLVGDEYPAGGGRLGAVQDRGAGGCGPPAAGQVLRGGREVGER